MSALDDTFEHHCELFFVDVHGDNIGRGDEKKKKCECPKTISVECFGMKDLPSEFKSDQNMVEIKNRIERTVMIKTKCISDNRPDTLPDGETPYPLKDYRGSTRVSNCGTGYIYFPHGCCKGEQCPCPKCKDSNQPKMEYWKFIVTTSTHVVFDTIEAGHTEVVLFYNKENKEGVEYLYGLKILSAEEEKYTTDQCQMVCVTHDNDLADRLEALCGQGRKRCLMDFRQNGILVHHPHGGIKKISVGKVLEVIASRKPGSELITLKKGCRVSIPNATEIKDDVEDPGMNTALPNTFNNYLNKTTGDIFELNIELKASLPPKTEIVCDWSLVPGWCTFPAGSEYFSDNGTDCVIVPVPIKFDKSDVFMHNSYTLDTALIYEMATCPGSSGANVGGGHYNFFDNWCHFGCREGTNRSGLSKFSPLVSRL